VFNLLCGDAKQMGVAASTAEGYADVVVKRLQKAGHLK